MFTRNTALVAVPLLAGLFLALSLWAPPLGDASSHREAPLISNDPLADNTDVYAYRAPNDPGCITIVANYIPFELPEGGPNYYTFGEDVRYEIHIKNDATTKGDDITYRFTFRNVNEDPTTFFNIRLGKRNLKSIYQVDKITHEGSQRIVEYGVVPPANIGPRSINSQVGLGTTYLALSEAALETAPDGEVIFAGPRDDPFFVDLSGIFDLGQTRSEYGPDPRNAANARDGVAGFNVHSIVMRIPIHVLQKDGKGLDEAANILDPDFVIGVWASASRQMIRTLSPEGEKPTHSGEWVQVSRLGMPLTNEVVIPIGEKDRWNANTPYTEDPAHSEFFYNPELALYMNDDQFGAAVPALAELRIQRNSLGQFDFGNGQDGLFPLKGNPALDGTALDDDVFGTLLLPGPGKPRSVDLWPAFYTGVPNVAPYQLATGKGGNPLAEGKPFVNNFLPTGGDMLRLNMAVPPTPRDHPDFSSLGLVQAAVLGLTDPRFNGTKDLQFIPNMDGFPNGRRLEDDVTTIELQAVAGVVLAAVGLWYDDFDPTDPNASPVTDDLLGVLTYNAGPTQNDLKFTDRFPYLREPHRGWDYVKQLTAAPPAGAGGGGVSTASTDLGVGVPDAFILEQNHPNPFNPSTSISYHVARPGTVTMQVYDVQGRVINTLVQEEHRAAGTYTVNWDASSLSSGTYFYQLFVDGNPLPAKKAILMK